MMHLSRLFAMASGLVLVTSLCATAQPTKPLTPADKVAPSLLVTRIDANCAVVQAAIKSQTPTEVVRKADATWHVVTTADGTMAERTNVHLTHARVWKQAGNYVWATWAERSAKGALHADQMCFRTDGTLARMRQATSVRSLDSAIAREAYYNRDGSLIKRTTAFAIDDPAIYKHISDLPFFNLLH